jgi:D-glutamate cyclase
MSKQRLISEIERLIRRDPARRGLIGADGNGPGEGELAAASELFLGAASGACLITGFFIPAISPGESGSSSLDPGVEGEFGNAETDGPPGTVVLADVLVGLGVPVTVITDELCESVVRSACSAGIDHEVNILVSPIEPNAAATWRTDILNRDEFQQLSHIVAIERVGPGHTVASLETSELSAVGFSTQGESNTPVLSGHCCNMRGENIDRFSADLHLLVESVKMQKPTVRLIGVGDGGNEIGMGRFPWSELRTRIPGPNADRIPCRIAADSTIVAGVSNWGAYALAAAIAVQHDRLDLLERHTAHSQQLLIEKIVSEAEAVDGVTRRNEPTVDGLPFVTQIQPWIAIRQRLGLQP